MLANQWLTATNLIKQKCRPTTLLRLFGSTGQNLSLSAQIERPRQKQQGRKNLARLAPEGLRGAGLAMILKCIANAKPIMAATSDEEQVFN